MLGMVTAGAQNEAGSDAHESSGAALGVDCFTAAAGFGALGSSGSLSGRGSHSVSLALPSM